MFSSSFGTPAFRAGGFGGGQLAGAQMSEPSIGQGPAIVEFGVYDAATDKPIPGARIELRHGGRVTSWVTDAAGRLTKSIAVDPGDLVQVTVSAPGYRPQANPAVLAQPMQGMARVNFMLKAVPSTETLIGAGLFALILGAVFLT